MILRYKALKDYNQWVKKGMIVYHDTDSKFLNVFGTHCLKDVFKLIDRGEILKELLDGKRIEESDTCESTQD